MKMRLEFRICRWMCILNNGYLRQGEIPAVVVIRKGWRRKAYIKYINKKKAVCHTGQKLFPVIANDMNLLDSRS